MKNFDETFSEGLENTPGAAPSPEVNNTRTPEEGSAEIPVTEEPAAEQSEDPGGGAVTAEKPVPSAEPNETVSAETGETVIAETPVQEPVQSGPRPYQDLYDTMAAYNADLSQNGQKLVDVWSYEEPPFDLSSWDMLRDSPTIGYISIPDMGIVLPLFLGASTDNLEKGAAVLSQTSMPIGGDSTNCVIAGHRGWEGSAYFQYVENMKLGSLVYITNPWETLVYKCTEIQITYPNDVDAVLIRPGKDMITLFTCHPYVLGGGPYRYLVFCERTDTQERQQASEMKNPKAEEPAENAAKPDIGIVATAYEEPVADVPEAEPEAEPAVTGTEPAEAGTETEGISLSPTINPSIPPAMISSGEAESDNLLLTEAKLRVYLPAAILLFVVFIILLRILAWFINRRKRKKKKKKKSSSKPKKTKPVI